MHILIGLSLALVLLYFWLSGHWFARIVTFLALAVVCGIGVAALAATIAQSAGAPPGNPAIEVVIVLGAIVGAALAWPLASIPTWHYRRQAQRLQAAADASWAPHSAGGSAQSPLPPLRLPAPPRHHHWS
jgi:hypothetical protein